MANELKFQIKISGENFTFEQVIDELQKAKIISFLNLPSVAIPSDESSYVESSAKVINPNNTQSPTEFLLQKNAQTNVHKIAVFMMYIEDVLLQNSATKEEIKTLFEKSKQTMPQNFTRDFDKATTSALISEASEQGKFYLTQTGRQTIENGFKEEKLHKKVTSKKGIKKTVLTVRDEVEALQIVPDLNGYKNYWRLNKGERILWLILQADLNGINSLNYRELSHLAEKMHDNIPPKNVSALADIHEKNRRLTMTLENNIRKLKILKDGIDYLKLDGAPGEVA